MAFTASHWPYRYHMGGLPCSHAPPWYSAPPSAWPNWSQPGQSAFGPVDPQPVVWQ